MPACFQRPPHRPHLVPGFAAVTAFTVCRGAPFALALAAILGGCASADEAPEARPTVSLGGDDAGADGSTARPVLRDGGFETADGGVIRADRFVTEVVRFTPGDCGGFGVPKLPDVVLGPPVGGGDLQGGLDVVSLGLKGEIVVGFGQNAIVDGPGPDFIVFENAFYAAGDPSKPAADLGEVSVSDDGVSWKTFPCTAGDAPPFAGCAGWHAVYSAPGNGISPVDPSRAGGEAYDLSEVGLTAARFVRIRDLGRGTCPTDPAQKPTTAGFDLDAISLIHAALP